MVQKAEHAVAGQRHDWNAIVADYYSDPIVRTRIREFLGGDSEVGISAVYINGNDASQDCRTAPLDPMELDRCFEERKEIYRSLWDRNYLVVNLDIDYVNLDDPGHSYQDFEAVYALEQPIVRVIEAKLKNFGITALHVLSGRGHHFTWNIRRDSAAFLELAQLGHLTPSLQGKYAQAVWSNSEAIEQPLARAFAGLALVLEYLAHEILQKDPGQSSVPLTLSAVETVSNQGVRESISIDLTEYGDPLHTRGVRVPFSVYYKPLQQAQFIGHDVVSEIPPLFILPVEGFDELRAARMMRDAEEAKRVAREATARIPEQSAGSAELIKSYRASQLAQIHAWYYSQEHEPPERWPLSYDATDLNILPPSARKILEEPNDLLLKPGCLRHLVRVFLALGWHPRHIAGLVRSKFERDYGWGNEWFCYDAATRADFYCRLFTGLIVSGRDDLSDFSCPPVDQLRGAAHEWNENFEPFKDSLRRRIQHDRLASRPFHGLFL